MTVTYHYLYGVLLESECCPHMVGLYTSEEEAIKHMMALKKLNVAAFVLGYTAADSFEGRTGVYDEHTHPIKVNPETLERV